MKVITKITKTDLFTIAQTLQVVAELMRNKLDASICVTIYDHCMFSDAVMSLDKFAPAKKAAIRRCELTIRYVRQNKPTADLYPKFFRHRLFDNFSAYWWKIDCKDSQEQRVAFTEHLAKQARIAYDRNNS